MSPTRSTTRASATTCSRLYHLTKAFDATRPVVDNDGWHHLATDICTIHDYAFDGALCTPATARAEAVERTVRGRQPADRARAPAGP